MNLLFTNTPPIGRVACSVTVFLCCNFVSYVLTATMFTLKTMAEESMEGGGDEEEDDFQTDEDEQMEVDKQVLQKRKKVCRNLEITFSLGSSVSVLLPPIRFCFIVLVS